MGSHAMTTEEISFTDFIASSIHDMKNSLNVQVSGLEDIAAACRARGDATTLAGLGPIIHQAHRMNANLIQLLSLYKLDKAILRRIQVTHGRFSRQCPNLARGSGMRFAEW